MDVKNIALGVVAAAAVAALAYWAWSGNRSTPAAKVSCPAGYVCTPAGQAGQPTTAPAPVQLAQRGQQQPRTAPVTRRGDYVLRKWTEGMNSTPPPRGYRWRRITPRATGDYGCTPGEVRRVRRGNKWVLQGCR